VTANDAWCSAANTLLSDADTKVQDSQHGVTRELLHASFNIRNPRERWVVSRHPGINPAFAIAEVFWILTGRNDAAFINYWNSKYRDYAGDGDYLHGAYGYRLRQQFGFDQLERTFAALENNSDSRQIVLSIWDGRADMPSADGLPVSRDIPCNVCSMLKVRDRRLEWMQVMRSNDLFLGTPYNFIQFTTLQEIVAGWLGLEMGEYCQLSDSLHVYDLYDGKENRYSISRNAGTAENSDDLRLPKRESETTLKSAMDILETLARPDLSIKRFRNISDGGDLSDGYRNLVLISAADAARRREWYSDMDRTLSRCTNPMLLATWTNWRQQYLPIS
jgi:thymidylate synthase